MELEEKLRKSEREKEELLQRAKNQYHNESERVDELLYENDNLKREVEKLTQRLKALQENASTLSLTLNETQQELENLVNEHERLSEEY
jgi:chromosome segregation ATPase